MATTVHIPDPLLKAVDRRAAELRLSRNRYIVQTLARAVQSETEWSDHLFEVLEGQAPEDAAEVDTMMEAIRGSRSSKSGTPL